MSINYQASSSSSNILGQLNDQTSYYMGQARSNQAQLRDLQEVQMPALQEKLKAAEASGDQNQISQAQLAIDQMNDQMNDIDHQISQDVAMANSTMALFNADTSSN